MNIRLIALDLDGTIVNRDLVITPRVKAAIERAQAQGVLITLASGRMYKSTTLFAQELDIRTPLICYQGGMVRAVGEEPLLHLTVPSDLAEEIIMVGQKKGLRASVYLDDRLYIEKGEGEWGGVLDPVMVEAEVVEDLLPILAREPTKVTLGGEEEIMERLAASLQGHYRGRLQVTRSYPLCVEATHPHATKGRALEFLARHFGIRRDDVMAIGDYDNDVDMISWAGLGIAMGNASPALLAAADEVVPPWEENGAAVAIERHVLS